MLIVCPSCASEYSLDPDRIGPEGRTVRCAACREPWFVAKPAAPEPGPELTPPGEAVFTAVEEEPAPPRPAPRPARTPSRAGRRILLIAGLALAACACGGIVLARTAVVRALPQTARLYAAIGLPVNLRGLAFRDVVAFQTAAEGGSEGRLVVEGDVVSASREARAVPPLALEVRDAADQVIYRWTAEAPRARLEPEEAARFRAELAAPPVKGRRVLVRFAAVDTGKSPVSLGGSASAHE
jgi:predicted Zn finger-like uncharacterized protein